MKILLRLKRLLDRTKRIYQIVSFLLIYITSFKSRDILIFDIDETVCITAYGKYRLQSNCIIENLKLIEMLKSGKKCYFLSARPIKYHFLTHKWLKLNKIPFIVGFTGFHPRISFG